jgi:hypothetical protein
LAARLQNAEAVQDQAGAGGDIAAAHEAMLKTPGLQFDFASVPAPPKPPGWLRPLLELLDAIAPVLGYIFWGGLILGAALLLYFVGREVLASRFGWTRRARPKPTPEWRPEPEQAKALLEDADRLAAEGRFDEAAHLLLFRSIDDLSGRRPGAVRPALTTRDIAAIDAMPSTAREAFSRIAGIVERSFFGGRPVGREDFDACRAAYEGFAFAEGWR